MRVGRKMESVCYYQNGRNLTNTMVDTGVQLCTEAIVGCYICRALRGLVVTLYCQYVMLNVCHVFAPPLQLNPVA